MKKLLAWLLAVCLLLSTVPLASALPSEEAFALLYETKEDGNTYITGYTGVPPANLTIPSEIDGVEIYGVWTEAFNSANIQELTISTKVICQWAFVGCSIQTLICQEGVETIGQLAFEFNWRLKNVTLPSSLRRIEDGAFGCTGLEQITLPEGLLHLGGGAFGNSQITEITFPDTLKSYDRFEVSSDIAMVRANPDEALQRYCEEHDLRFYNLQTGQITELGYETVIDGVTYKVYPYSGYAKAIASDRDLLPEQLVIPSEVDGQPVTELCSHVFGARMSLRSVYIPDTVTTIGSAVFSHCDKLSAVRMSENLRSIGESVFYGTAVTLIYLPPTLEEFVPIAQMMGIGEPHRVIAGFEGSVAQQIAKEGGNPFYPLQEDRVYLYADNNLFFLQDGEAVAACLCNVDNSNGRVMVIPELIGIYPVTAMEPGCIYGDNLDVLMLGGNIRRVEKGTLVFPMVLYIPPSVTYIADTPPEGCTTVIFGTPGSYAQTYAETYGLEFYDMDAIPFRDVPLNSWYYSDVCNAYWSGMMNGTSDTTFEPEGAASRAMVVKVLHNMSGAEELEYDCGFQDAPRDSWFFHAVNWAHYYGIANGISPTEFDPHSPVTREQFATFLYRYAVACGLDCGDVDELQAFNDRAQVSDYARDAMGWAVAAGILRGMDSTTLSPRDTLTRAQMAAMLCRFLAWATQ